MIALTSSCTNADSSDAWSSINRERAWCNYASTAILGVVNSPEPSGARGDEADDSTEYDSLLESGGEEEQEQERATGR